jgi:hypothetical protein
MMPKKPGTNDASCLPTTGCGGCCQGNGGFTFDQTYPLEEKQDKSVAAE